MSIRDDLDISAYLVLGPENTLGRPVSDVVTQALDAGFTCIQVRSKVASAREIIALTGDAAQAIAQAGKTGQVALLIDDRLDCVLAAREQGIAVDGVHVGQSDIPVEVCRKLLGPDAIVGLSARCEEMLEYVKTADMSLVDYLGIGPLHETETKRGCGRAADGSIITKSFEDLAARFKWTVALPAPSPCGKPRAHRGGRRRQNGRSSAAQDHRRRWLLCGERRLQCRRPLRRSQGARRYLAAGIGPCQAAAPQPHIFNSGKRIPVWTSILGCAFRRGPYPARYASSAGSVASASRRPI